MEARASAKYLRGSAQKARLVVDMIRGKRVGEALAILRFTNKRAASGIEKCLRSAIANATETAERENVAVDPDELVVKTCFVDMGPTKGRRRMRPAPQGRAYREQRHYCHITIHVTSEAKAKSEKEIAEEEARQQRIAARKAERAKAPVKKEARATKLEEKPVEEAAEAVTVAEPVETPVVDALEETPIETPAEDIAATTAEET